MNIIELNTKLDTVLNRLGMNTESWRETISCFRKKIELLFEANNYSRLLKALFSSNDLSEFNSYVFEVLFAYDFESNNHPLVYEAKPLPDKMSTVDFCYKLDESSQIFFELRLIQQKKMITDSIKSQLDNTQYYEVHLGGDDEAVETVRIQGLILSKCQSPDGAPIKFGKPTKNETNIIAVNVSELHLSMIDIHDCVLAMYGDDKVALPYRRGIFGLWQMLPKNPSEEEKGYFRRFKNIRETIHGVLFVRYVKDSGHMDRMYIDRELEYLLIPNSHLWPEKESRLISERLNSFLPKWDNGNSNR